MSDNPFDKTKFPTYRDWEKSLVDFFVREAKTPCAENWQSMVNGAAPANSVAYCALFLSNLLANKPHFAQSAETLYSTYAKLTENKSGVPEYDAWLHTNWLNVSRVANQLKAEMARDTNTQTSS